MVFRHGLLLETVSDNIKEFGSEIIGTLMKLMGIKKTNTTPHHQQKMQKQRSAIKPLQLMEKLRF
jgi:hypothetical protein